MADENKIAAAVRTQFGKGFARRLRAADQVPAVIYGHGTEPRHVSLPGHELMLATRKANALLDLDIEGDSQLVLVKDLQKDPVRQIIEHVDLIVVRKGEKVVIDVPVHVEGESAPGTIVALDATTLSVEAEATHIPERLTVDVEGLEEGTQILAGQVALPSGSTLVSDAEVLVVNITVPAVVDLGESEETEGEEGETAEGDAAEGETAEGESAEAAE